MEITKCVLAVNKSQPLAW